MEGRKRNEPGHIVAPLQAQESSWASLEFAAQVAKALEVELQGLLLEDEEAFAAASLPFTKAISFQSGAVRNFDIVGLEAAYRASASRAKARVSTIGVQHAVACSFSVLNRFGKQTSSSSSDVLESSTALLVIDRRQIEQWRRQSNRKWLLGVAPIYLVCNPVSTKQTRIRLLYEGKRETLAAAAKISTSLSFTLEVLTLADNRDTLDRRLRQARDWIRRRQIKAKVSGLLTDDREWLHKVTNMTDDDIVLFDRTDLLSSLVG